MPRPSPSRDLVAREAISIPGPDRAAAGASPQSWIAVSMPNLAFDVFGSAATDGPAAVVEPVHGQAFVVAANRHARRCGIVPGVKLNSAFALAASLRVFERSPHRERAGLESLSAWAQMLTSTVCIEQPETVLLEVAGSVKLFGSLAAIKNKLGEEVAKLRWSSRLCVAPTATAALWLARGGGEDVESLGPLAGGSARCLCESRAGRSRFKHCCSISASARSPIVCACRGTVSRGESVLSICTISIER